MYSSPRVLLSFLKHTCHAWYRYKKENNGIVKFRKVCTKLWQIKLEKEGNRHTLARSEL